MKFDYALLVPALVVAFAASASAQASSNDIPDASAATADATYPVTTPATEIQIPETSARSTFNALVAIGLKNHIPIGIIVGDAPNTEICGTPPNLKRRTMTVAELIAAIKAALPHYRADLQNGVLDISPAKLPKSTAQLLDLRLAHFHSAPDSHTAQGEALWMSIHGVLAPGANSNFVFFSSFETAPGVDASNQNVKTILNMIVDKGNGGVWILRSSKIQSLSPETHMPFEIYGYAGESPALAANLTCLR